MTKKFNIIPPKSLDYIRDGTSKPVAQMTVDEIPPVAISWGRTTVFKTGSWRNVTPRYVRQMPPCRAGCPVGNDVEGWLEAAANENWNEAVDLLLGEQPLPSVCGRVCYHPCETACNRGQFDSPVSIRSVERFLGDNPFIQFMYITNTSGKKTTRNICSIVDKAKFERFKLDDDFSNRKWFIGPMKDGDIHVTDFYTSIITGALCITVSGPIRDKNDEIVGILGIDIKFEDLVKMEEEENEI